MIDFNSQAGQATLNNSLDLVLQQIDILFDTVPGEVLGDLQYGTKYDHYLYDLKFSPQQLQSLVIKDLQSLNLLGWSPTVNVILLDGTERDIVLIKIDLYNDNYKHEKIYKIS